MHMHEEKETGRVEGFSDHVFAIAMTLLVIEIKIPSQEQVAAEGLAQALAALWPSYLAFLTSFFHNPCHLGASPLDLPVNQ